MAIGALIAKPAIWAPPGDWGPGARIAACQNLGGEWGPGAGIAAYQTHSGPPSSNKRVRYWGLLRRTLNLFRQPI